MLGRNGKPKGRFRLIHQLRLCSVGVVINLLVFSASINFAFPILAACCFDIIIK
jgi:hypothetical protein